METNEVWTYFHEYLSDFYRKWKFVKRRNCMDLQKYLWKRLTFHENKSKQNSIKTTALVRSWYIKFVFLLSYKENKQQCHKTNILIDTDVLKMTVKMFTMQWLCMTVLTFFLSFWLQLEIPIRSDFFNNYSKGLTKIYNLQQQFQLCMQKYCYNLIFSILVSPFYRQEFAWILPVQACWGFTLYIAQLLPCGIFLYDHKLFLQSYYIMNLSSLTLSSVHRHIGFRVPVDWFLWNFLCVQRIH